ncbi:3-ketoacyl-CoA thiolase with broad chain length specificity [Tilletia horrida]|nr:3-ketoacyl-CoA thiolase with broad chain length specificity [Tilletia horrida]KAK0523549.1 3-ketoacyl-CoA thiolase with broad chain length specificity [Tilletia horrida]KAK0555855.1 3-ketoacyl-CoA thiolase with broad chain length specificity [Tilletia horrida]
MVAQPKGKSAILEKHDDDVVIVAALRSPMTRGKKGGLSQCCPEEMLGQVLKGVVAQSKIDPKLIDDIAVGNVLPPGGGATVARMAALWAGIPNTTALNTLNRQCSSGLAATNQIANEIKTGQIDIGIGAGVESMTQNYGAGVMPEKMSDAVMENEEASDCLAPMGITSENVAAEYNITRDVQDQFAAESYQKAAAAQKAGKFKSEIVTIKYEDEDGNERVIDTDDGIREGVTKESLSKLKPAFSKTGSTTAGNASQVSDGAAAVLLARRSVAKKLGLPIIGKFVQAAVVGVPPRVMGIGPAFAIPRVLELTGLSNDDIDIFEINEAFASQAVYSVQKAGIDPKKVNPVGGAIAMGHPLGCTGARQIATGLAEAKRENKKLIVTSMCIGTGMGMASVIVNEQ